MVTDEWLSRYNTEFEIRNAFEWYKQLFLFHEEYGGTEPNDPELDNLQQRLNALKTKALLMGIHLED